MRTPIRSETEAFRLTVAGALVIAASVLVGWLFEPWAGAVLFGVALLSALVAYLRAPNPDRREVLLEAVHGPHLHEVASGRRHILVVANETLGSDELCARIAGNGAEVEVVAPVLTSHLHLGLSDIDSELDDARARLHDSLEWLRQHDVVAYGQIGDPAPTTALEDALREAGADEVIVFTHASEDESWQEHDELERLRRELDVPVTQMVAGR